MSKSGKSVSNDNLYIIEKIINKRYCGKKMMVQYLVKWKGYSNKYNTWEPIDNLKTCPEYIDDYEQSAHRRRFKRRKVVKTTDDNVDKQCVKLEDNKLDVKRKIKKCLAVKQEIKSEFNHEISIENNKNNIVKREIKTENNKIVKCESNKMKTEDLKCKNDKNGSESDIMLPLMSELISEINSTYITCNELVEQDFNQNCEQIIIPNTEEIDEETDADQSDNNWQKIAKTDLTESLKPMQILGICELPPKLSFLMTYADSDETHVVPAQEANVKCPQLVIQFYENLIKWNQI
jgi:hypothetical protein